MKRPKPKTLIYEILIGLLFFILVIILIGRFYQRKDKNSDIKVEDEINDKLIDYSKIDVISGKYYYEDEHFTSSFGIDVSDFQDDIDWKKVSEDKVEFVYIRIGRRGATTGLLYDDPRFEVNYEGARRNGLKTGVYFFSQAISEAEAIEEADWIIERLKDKEVDLPIVYDCEEVFIEDEESRMKGLEREQITKNVISFMNELEKHGYEGMIYTYLYWADTYYDMEQLQRYPFWFAQYDTDEPKFQYPFAIWQYSNHGSINGIKEDTDLNIWFIPKEK